MAEMQASEKRVYGTWKTEDMISALVALRNGGKFNETSRRFGIPKPTLRRHLHGLNKYATEGVKHAGRQCTLTEDLENRLVRQIIYLQENLFGITRMEVMQMAFDMAESEGLSHMFSRGCAGKVWFTNFLRRHPELCLRTPEARSASRIVSFTQENVDAFFTLVESVLDDHNLDGSQIYNMDEAGLNTVHKPPRILAKKGSRRVAAVTSGERGVNTTVVCCCNAAGRYVPPMIIFKRKRMLDALKEGAPPGSLVVCNDSGWMDKPTFLKWMEHFVANVKPSRGEPVLLIIDGHTSHTKNLEAIELARQSGVIMISLPPHCSDRMQPLDVAFFKPLKTHFRQAAQAWMRNHPGRKISNLNMASLFAEAYMKSATMTTASNGFASCGIWPCNRGVFQEHDFLPAASHEVVSGNQLRERSLQGESSPPPRSPSPPRQSDPGTARSPSPRSPTPPPQSFSGTARSPPPRSPNPPPQPPDTERTASPLTRYPKPPPQTHPSSTTHPLPPRPTPPTLPPRSSSAPPLPPRPTPPPLPPRSQKAPPLPPRPTPPPLPPRSPKAPPLPPRPNARRGFARGCDSDEPHFSSGTCRIVAANPDGRCLFRSVAIAMDDGLKATPRDKNCLPQNTHLKIKEQIQADKLRAETVEYMMANIRHYQDLPPEVLNGDQPGRRFKTIEDRILAMAVSSEMAGEMEVFALSMMVCKPIIILDQNLRIIKKYNMDLSAAQPTLYVQYINFHDDVGHYNCVLYSPTLSDDPSTNEGPHTSRSSTVEGPHTSRSSTSEGPHTSRSSTVEGPHTSHSSTSEGPHTSRSSTSEGPHTSRKNKPCGDRCTGQCPSRLSDTVRSRKSKAEILTSSPYKLTLHSAKPRRAEKRPLVEEKTTNVRSRKRKTANQEGDWFCFLCCESVCENMIQCQECKMWAHDQCAGNPRSSFVCDFCKH